ncbi:MAG: YggS family pyridoxal phosphate-dependent enzyme [Treponema sp.]|jgi:pyridoxal phosphate enzyme (YggS family)|nr:YggS family pyridoxal phosphate-dependent enzyme [Treponema sp.]
MSMGERIDGIRERIEKACLRSGRKPEEVRLMGVSKFHGTAEIEEALGKGITLFGESRVQEAVKKYPPLRQAHEGLELHMIGSLQRNKIKSALEVFDGVQSLDRDGLIAALGALTEERNQPLMVLLEFHTGEDSKSGYPSLDSLLRAAELVLSFRCLKLSGLMTMAPYTEDKALVRRSFRAAAAARDALWKRFPGTDLSCLSMGMSGDFETAVEEGSTLVRVGTAIFGECLP